MSVQVDVRCSGASLADAEPMAGTAPTERDWLFVEYAGSWGRQAVADSRLPDEVREHLAAWPGRVQLVRRHGREPAPGAGVRVFAATLGQTPVVRAGVLDRVEDLLTLADGDLTPYAGPLWLVCTNGRRDRCCAEVGRPVTATLAARWPEATWETTHLGGHRFSGTLLALPSGLTLGRLDAESAVRACEEVEAGRVPVPVTRGRAGLDGASQVAELHLRTAHGLTDVLVRGRDGDRVLLSGDGEPWEVTVTESPGEPRAQSCGDLKLKAAPVYSVSGSRRSQGT
ncbi:MAG: sucrase ferredoxin [Nocardioides sp.]|nr:sucrase ferredoxin [Nocardioides sp.]